MATSIRKRTENPILPIREEVTVGEDVFVLEGKPEPAMWDTTYLMPPALKQTWAQAFQSRTGKPFTSTSVVNCFLVHFFLKPAEQRDENGEVVMQDGQPVFETPYDIMEVADFCVADNDCFMELLKRAHKCARLETDPDKLRQAAEEDPLLAAAMGFLPKEIQEKYKLGSTGSPLSSASAEPTPITSDDKEPQ